MLGRICPPDWNRVVVSENFGATAVKPVATAVMSLSSFPFKIIPGVFKCSKSSNQIILYNKLFAFHMKLFTFEGLVFEIVAAVCVWGYLFDAPDQVVVGIVEAVAGGRHHPDAIGQPDCWPKYPDTRYPLWYPFSRDHHGLAYPCKSKGVHFYLSKKIYFLCKKPVPKGRHIKG